MIYVVFMVLWIGAKIAYQIKEEKTKKIISEKKIAYSNCHRFSFCLQNS